MYIYIYTYTYVYVYIVFVYVYFYLYFYVYIIYIYYMYLYIYIYLSLSLWLNFFTVPGSEPNVTSCYRRAQEQCCGSASRILRARSQSHTCSVRLLPPCAASMPCAPWSQHVVLGLLVVMLRHFLPKRPLTLGR